MDQITANQKKRKIIQFAQQILKGGPIESQLAFYQASTNTNKR